MLDRLAARHSWPARPSPKALPDADRAAPGPGGGAGGPGAPATWRLWAGTDGEAAAALFAELIDEAAALPPVNPRGFADLVDGLMAGPGGALRAAPPIRGCSILGAIEARLVRADRLVIAGLEEGVWPPAAPLDPFLSRPMRDQPRPAAARAPPRPGRPRLRPGRLRARGDPDRLPNGAAGRRR